MQGGALRSRNGVQVVNLVQKKNVLVLMGGPSTEHEISLKTGRMIASSLDKEKYNVMRVEITEKGWWRLIDETASDCGCENVGFEKNVSRWSSIQRILDSTKIDVVFNAMHGAWGEDGTIQGMLESLGLPYTGSGVMASALAMDKWRSRQVFKANGINTPRTLALHRRLVGGRSDIENFARQALDELGLPCVTKPNDHGSSVGVSIIQKAEELVPALEGMLKLSSVALVEEYLEGTEITVGVLDDPRRPQPLGLPVVEIIPKSTWFDYESKYQAGGAEEIVPARISAELTKEAQATAVKAHLLLGCRAYSRTDMIICNNKIYVLETNTLPGMTETSLYPQEARAIGIEFPQLLDMLIEIAMLGD